MRGSDPRGPTGGVGRRVFLELFTAGGAAGWLLPACDTSSGSPSPPPAPAPFFTDAERSAVTALADFVLPKDDQPSGSELGVVPYLEELLTAFDYDPPKIHAGGPYSGRMPFPASTGTASTHFPDNAFQDFVPLSRMATAAWKIRIYGSAGVPGGAPNDKISGPVVGLRDMVKQGLAQAMAASTVPLSSADAAALEAIWAKLPASFTTGFSELVVEAALAAPEYGGNTNLLGWRMVHVDGDTQPLGYSLFDVTTGAYKERLPVSTPGTGEDPDPLDAETRATLDTTTRILGGRVSG